MIMKLCNSISKNETVEYTNNTVYLIDDSNLHPLANSYLSLHFLEWYTYGIHTKKLSEPMMLIPRKIVVRSYLKPEEWLFLKILNKNYRTRISTPLGIEIINTDENGGEKSDSLFILRIWKQLKSNIIRIYRRYVKGTDI